MAHIGSYNKVVILGRLGKDPEFHSGQNTSRCNLSVATKEKYSYGANQKEKTEWHFAIAWGKQAEFCRDNLIKGMLVFIEGKLVTSYYGNKKSVYVSVQTIVSMSPKISDADIGKEEETDDDESSPY